MFRIARLLLSASLLSAALLPLVVAPASAVTAALMDSIAPGVMHGTEGFGTSTVLVPKAGYVTGERLYVHGGGQNWRAVAKE